jgi:hypothetical protein
MSYPKLLVSCCECAKEGTITLGVNDRIIPAMIRKETGWILSHVGHGRLAFVCKECAERIYPPQLIQAADFIFSRKPD